MDLHWEVVAEEMRRVIHEVARLPFSPRFYLAGGTALALQYGHRKSIDLDYFSETDQVDEVTHAELKAALGQRKEVENPRLGPGFFECEIRGVRTGFFSYGYPLLEPVAEVDGLRLCSPLDIGLMKLDALIGRGAKKDFVDLYFIAQHLTLDYLLEQTVRKYAWSRNMPVRAIRFMTMFENAEKPQEMGMLASISWQEIKWYFKMEARRLAQEWFEA